MGDYEDFMCNLDMEAVHEAAIRADIYTLARKYLAIQRALILFQTRYDVVLCLDQYDESLVLRPETREEFELGRKFMNTVIQ